MGANGTGRRLTVAMINAVVDGDYQYEQELPLGLAAVGAFLRTHGFSVTFHQCFASRGNEAYQAAGRLEADVYAFQLNMVNFPHVKAVVEEVKKNFPQAVTIFGGPFLVSLSEDILRNEPLFDFVVLGEGELTTLELLEALEKGGADYARIESLVWRTAAGEVVRNHPRPLIPDLDVLPFPARDSLEEGRRDPNDGGLIESVRMSSSRGCVGRCSFCCVNLYNRVQKGRGWRGHSAERVVDELEHLVKNYHARIFNFSDSSFEDPGLIGKERSRRICEEILRRRLEVSIKIYMRCETMLPDQDRGLLELYKRAGIDVIIIGAEAGSDDELRLYEKHATLKENYRTAHFLNELDLFYVLVGFIMFGPNSTVTTLRANIDYLYKFGWSDNLMLVANVLMLIRDSKLYRVLKEEGRVVDDPQRFWELPRYLFKDAAAERAAKHWQNLFVRYPATLEVNKLQVNLGNVVARMTNAMNGPILQALQDEYLEFKDSYRRLTAEFCQLQYDYFKMVLDLVEGDCSDHELRASGDEFFGKVYQEYLPVYEGLYDGFLKKVVQRGFGLSGLVFKHFHSAMAQREVERIS